MKVVITGGAGFFGYHIARAFGEVELVLLDLEKVAQDEIPNSATSVECIQGDVRDRDLLRSAFQNADVVVHAAAALPLWKAREIRSVNLNGTKAVLEIAKETNVPRVVHISSTAVYGIPDHHPLNENDPLHGVGPYGESKVAAERLCEQARSKDFCVPILRPKTFIGPERLGVFQILFDWVREGRRIPVIGNGHNRYQLLDVADAAQAVVLLATCHAGDCNGAFNIGSANFDTVKNDLNDLFKHANSGSTLFATPALFAKTCLAVLGLFNLSPLYKWVWGTADQDSWVDCTAITNLGWKPKYSNSDTLIRTYDWYLQNRSKMKSAGYGHRAPWREGALSLLRKLM